MNNTPVYFGGYKTKTMKTIQEVFKNNPQLLEEPEVKELISEFRSQYMNLKNAKLDFWDKVTDLTMHSNLFLIDGLTCENVVEKIHDLAFGN